jgi:hypothetical protein
VLTIADGRPWQKAGNPPFYAAIKCCGCGATILHKLATAVFKKSITTIRHGVATLLCLLSFLSSAMIEYPMFDALYLSKLKMCSNSFRN